MALTSPASDRVNWDCTECGAAYGVGYDLCPVCTPEVVRQARAVYIQRTRDLLDSGLDRTAVLEQTVDLLRRYKALYNKHNTNRRR